MPAPGPFVWVESPGTQLVEKPRVKRTGFGDGYVQRSPDGLNPLAQAWNVPFTGVDNVIADEIVAYWRACGAVDAFEWTPLWHTEPIKVVCEEWTRTQGEKWGQSDLVAKFQQVFEP